jgi:uncharacterized RDD family membrane protein YckC
MGRTGIAPTGRVKGDIWLRMLRGRIGTEKEAVGRRILAFIIDSLIISLFLAMVWSAGVIYVFRSGSEFLGYVLVSAQLSLPIIWLTLWFVYAFVLEGWKGQTIGKKLLSLVVVGKDGNACGFRRSFIRNVLRYIDGLGYYIPGLIVMLLSEKRQRIGDHLARTFVVKAKE